MNPSLSVVLVHHDESERSQLRAAFQTMDGVQIAGERGELRSGIAMAHQIVPAILVLDLSGPGDVLATAAQFHLDHPDVAIFLSTDQFNPDTLVRAMRVGVQEVLRKPLDRAALTAAVERIAVMAARKGGAGRTRSVLTVFSNKGGVGCSTLATNLAMSLRRQTGAEVVIADLDYQSGDVASMLGLVPQRSLSDVIASGRLDSASLQDAMIRHSSGVSVLSQPDQMDHAEALTPPQAAAILDVLGATYDYVVLDAPHFFNDAALEIFDRSSRVLLVTELSIPCVRAARRSLDVFQRLNYLVVPDRLQLVVNRRSERSAITPAQVVETLGMPIAHSIVNDYAAVSESINLGHPLCLESPVSRAGRDIDGIVRALGHSKNGHVEVETTPARRGLRLFGKG